MGGFQNTVSCSNIPISKLYVSPLSGTSAVGC
jgi:hypothetical protein